jgi:hypothetical protein
MGGGGGVQRNDTSLIFFFFNKCLTFFHRDVTELAHHFSFAFLVMVFPIKPILGAWSITDLIRPTEYYWS